MNEGFTQQGAENEESAADLLVTGDALAERLAASGLVAELDIKFTKVEPGVHVEADMPVAPKVLQPFGIVHGGATLALLESAASLGAATSCDLEHETPFGVEVSVRHSKSAHDGTVHGEATYDHSEPSQGRAGGVKQYWTVRALDDAGDVLSEGVVVVKVVPNESQGVIL